MPGRRGLTVLSVIIGMGMLSVVGLVFVSMARMAGVMLVELLRSVGSLELVSFAGQAGESRQRGQQRKCFHRGAS
jgi:hypothetical protein